MAWLVSQNEYMDLDVAHYLGVYQTRLKMQEEGITNASEEVHHWTRIFVQKLKSLPSEELIRIEGKYFLRENGDIIAKRPSSLKSE